MKKQILLLAFMQLFLSINAQVTNGLVAKWSFNSGNANDEIGSNNGTVTGAILTSDRFGNANMAYEFDGVNDFINFGTDASIKPVTGTVSVWAKMIAVSNTGSGYLHNPIFLSKNLGHNDTYYEACGIGIRTTDNLAVTITTNYSTINEKAVYSTNSIALNTWYHYVTTYDDDSVSFYIDGVLQNRIFKGFASNFSLTDPVLIAASGSVINARFFNGAIDDIRIYNRVLNQQEIDSLFNDSDPLSAPIVFIPDANFKAYLVGNSAINTNGDNEIQVSEAAAFNGEFNCHNLGIESFTGIEAFPLLSGLYCNNSLATTLDLSNNPEVIYLLAYGTPFNSLNISQNNKIEQIEINSTELTILDLSHCTELTYVSATSNNQLTLVNLKNGNNTNVFTFNLAFNPNLTCVEVDDAAYSTSNWTNIPSGASFSESCITAPNAPTNLVVTLVGNDVTLSWQDNSNDETGFEVRAPQILGDTTSTWNQVHTTGANFTTTTIGTSSANGLYCYKVRAFKFSAGNYVYSDYTEVECVQKGDITNINDIYETNETIAVYPNPTNNQINFSTQTNVQLINVIGKIIADKKNVNMLDLSDQPAGTYFLTLTDNQGQVIQRSKILKQ
jgi:hypothetical protein